MRAILVVLLCCVSSVFSQAKVGTTGGGFLFYCPSIRAEGMGEAGAALIDRYSYFFNPASLGLMEDPRISFALSPLVTSYEAGEPGNKPAFQSGSVYVYPVGHARDRVSQWSIALAAQWVRLASPKIYERTYENGTYEGTGRTFSAIDNTYSMSAGVSRHSVIDVSAGVTAKIIHQDFYDYDATGCTADIGVMVRSPLFGDWELSADSQLARPRGRLVLGAAMSNTINDMKFIDKHYPFTRGRRFGASVDMQFKSYALVPAFEVTSYSNADPDEFRIGVEFDFRHAVQARAGRLMISNIRGDVTTFGVGASARGLYLLLKGGGRVADPLHGPDIQFAFAGLSRKAPAPMDGTKYFGVELKL